MAEYFIIFYCLFNRIYAKETNIEAQLSLSIINEQNIKDFIFFTDSLESSEWNIKEFKYFSENKIFTSFILSEQIYSYLNSSSNNYRRSTLVIKTEYFTKWNFNNWNKYFTVSQSIMYIVFNSINKLTDEEIRHINIIVPYNTEYYDIVQKQKHDFDIQESFRLLGTDRPNFIQDFGNYSKEKGLLSSNKGFYERRFDLNGTTLAGLLSSPELCMPDKQECKILEIWEIFAKMMNFHARYLLQEDFYYGIAYLRPYALNPLSPRNFVGPIFKQSYYIYMRDTLQEDHSLKSYIGPFSSKFWMCIILWIIILSVAHVAIRILINICITKENLKQYYLTLFSPIFSLFNQCDWDTSTNISMRLILLTTIFIAMIITNSYTATFTSFIMVKKPKLPFQDLEGFLEDGSYKLGSIAHTYPYFHFRNSENPKMQKIYNNYLNNQNDEMISTEDGLLRICIDKKYSFIAHSTAEYLYHKCQILRTPKPIIQSFSVFTLGLSHFKNIFNRNLMTLRSAGIIKRMTDEIDESPPSSKDDITMKVDFIRIMPVLLLFVTGTGISLGILIIELINAAYQRKKEQNAFPLNN